MVTVVEGKTASIEGLSKVAIETASTEICGEDTDSKNIKVRKVTTTDEDKDGISEGATGCTEEGALGLTEGKAEGRELGLAVDFATEKRHSGYATNLAGHPSKTF